MILYNIIYIHTVYIIYIYIVSCKVVSQGSPCCSWNPLGGLLEMARNWKFASKAILPLGSARILMIFLRRAIWSRNSFFFWSFQWVESVVWFFGRIYTPKHTNWAVYTMKLSDKGTAEVPTVFPRVVIRSEAGVPTEESVGRASSTAMSCTDCLCQRRRSCWVWAGR